MSQLIARLLRLWIWRQLSNVDWEVLEAQMTKPVRNFQANAALQKEVYMKSNFPSFYSGKKEN